MSRRRKTRIKAKQYKEHREENPFEDFQGSIAELYLMQILHFIKSNLKNVLITAAALVVAGSIVVIILVYLENEEQKSVAAFEDILEAQTSSTSLASSVLALEDIEKYEKEHSSNHSKKRAALARLKYLVEDKKYEEAAQNCEFLAKNMKSDEMAAWFNIRAGFLYEKAGKYSRALTSYQNISQNKSPIEIINAHARYGELRMLIKSDQLNDAKKVLKQMMNIESDRDEIKNIQKQALALLLIHTAK